MRVGVFLNQYAHAPDRQVASELVEQAEYLDSAGFDLLALGERHLYPDGFLDQAAAMAYLAGRTARIALCSAGFILPVLDDIRLAEYAGSLDVLSGGRVILGVVAGYRDDEFRMFGARLGDRAAALEAGLPRLRTLLDGGRVVVGEGSARSEAFVSPHAALSRRIPLWVGARAQAAVDRTARLADGWITSFNQTPEELAVAIPRFKAAAAAAGSRGEVVVCRDAFVAADRAAARAALEGPLLALGRRYATWKAGSPDAGRYLDDSIEPIIDRLILGSADEAVDQLLRYQRMGADRVILRCQFPGSDRVETLACLRRIGDSVLPALRAAADHGPAQVVHVQ